MTGNASDVDEATLRVLRALALDPRPPVRALPAARILRRAVAQRWELSDHVRTSVRDATRGTPHLGWFLRGALTALGDAREYHIAIGTAPGAWWQITATDPDWLVHLAGARDTDHARSPIRSRWGAALEDLAVVADGERALILDTYEDEVVAYHLPVAALVARDASATELRDLLGRIAGVRVERDDMFGNGPRVAAESLRSTTRAVRTWSGGRDEVDRALLALAAASQTSSPMPHHAVALARSGPLAWVRATMSDREWLWALLSTTDRVAVASLDHSHVLAGARTPAGLELALFATVDVRFS